MVVLEIGIILSILAFIIAIISLIFDLTRWYFYIAFPFFSIIFFLLFLESKSYNFLLYEMCCITFSHIPTQ